MRIPPAQTESIRDPVRRFDAEEAAAEVVEGQQGAGGKGLAQQRGRATKDGMNGREGRGGEAAPSRSEATGGGEGGHGVQIRLVFWTQGPALGVPERGQVVLGPILLAPSPHGAAGRGAPWRGVAPICGKLRADSSATWAVGSAVPVVGTPLLTGGMFVRDFSDGPGAGAPIWGSGRGFSSIGDGGVRTGSGACRPTTMFGKGRAGSSTE